MQQKQKQPGASGEATETMVGGTGNKAAQALIDKANNILSDVGDAAQTAAKLAREEQTRERERHQIDEYLRRREAVKPKQQRGFCGC